MLALKLHKTKRPNIGAKTFWIPIIDWRTARIHLSNWYKTLDHPKGKGINYITMAKIPKDHPVVLHVDWAVKYGTRINELPFVPMAQIETEIIDALKPLQDRLGEGLYHVGQGYIVFGEDLDPGRPVSEFPELILGAELPRSCVKWTKDVRLLFRGDKRQR